MSAEETIHKLLPSVPESEYGTEFRSHLLEQYKLYLSLADKVSERRQTANTFFLTVNSAIIAALGLTFPTDLTYVRQHWFIIGGALGTLLCISWMVMLRSYKKLNAAKFLVVHALESSLPVRPYDAEWSALGRGKLNKLYRPFTHVEQLIPVFL